MHRDIKLVFIFNWNSYFVCLVCIIIVLIQIKVIFLNQENFVWRNLQLIQIDIEQELFDLLVRFFLHSQFNCWLIILGNEKAQLIFIDNGQLGEINVNLIQPLNRQFSDRPAQALACTLAQVWIIFFL
jgi:hypothetical protein